MYYSSREVYEFISKQNGDPIVERKVCTVSGQSFAIYQSDLDFYKKMSPTFNGVIFNVPTPTLCPEERCRRRLSRQNMRTLYKRKCDATGNSIISNISPDKPYIVYDNTYRRSDNRDFRAYGRDFDFSKSFTEQYAELLKVVPQPNLSKNHLLDENSDYTNYSGSNKSCYLIFHADMNRDCMYGVGVKKCKNSIDILHTHSSEVMYETIDCLNCYHVFYAKDCENCQNCSYIDNCINCEYCFGCANLSQKRYCIFNVQYDKEYYQTFIENLNNPATLASARETYFALLQNSIRSASTGYQNEDVCGNHIYRSQHAHFCFDVQESKNVKYCNRLYNGENTDVYDLNEYGMQISKVYEGLAIGINAQNILTGMYVNEDVDSIYYSIHTHHAKHCFGCVGAVNAEYCIFNKQYSKGEYELTVAKIISHMIAGSERGEFFHPSLSLFGYNETVANEYFPRYAGGTMLASSDNGQDKSSPYSLQEFGYHRSDYNADPTIPEGADTIDRKINPDVSGLTDEQVLAKIYVCEVTNRPYRIIPQELVFYRKHNISLPRRHPDQRHADRMKLRAPRELHLRRCDKTGVEMLSVYPDGVPFKVYSDEAYQQEVFG